MRYLTLDSLPEIRFAHSFRAERYDNILGARKNSIEISYIVEGALHMQSPSGTVTAEPGNIICYLNETDIRVYSDGPHAHHTVSFSAAMSFTESPVPGSAALTELIKTTEAPSVDAQIIDIIKYHAIYPEDYLYGSGMILQLLSLISGETERMEKGLPHTELPYIRQAKQYVSQNIYRPIRQKDIAEYLNITPEYLSSIFRKSTGESVMHFINRTKLTGIVSLMEQENISLRAASEIYGYSDSGYVSRLYKKYYGIPLTQALTNTAPFLPAPQQAES